MPQAGIDPPAQSHDSFEASAHMSRHCSSGSDTGSNSGGGRIIKKSVDTQLDGGWK